MEPLRLLGIFADSLEDLAEIVNKVLHPSDVDTDLIGIRWAPMTAVSSRFGLDPTSGTCMQNAAYLVSKLPSTKKLGMQMHFASSNIGGPTWFELIAQFGSHMFKFTYFFQFLMTAYPLLFLHTLASFCLEFSHLTGREIAVIDFGGGWNPYFLGILYPNS